MKKNLYLVVMALVVMLSFSVNAEAKGKASKNDPASLVGATTVYKGVDYAAEYDPLTYYTMNPDLQAAFGTDAKALIKHYVEYGKKEGRVAIDPNASANAAAMMELTALASVDKTRLAGFALNQLKLSVPSLTADQVVMSNIYYTPANVAGHPMAVVVTPTGLGGKYKYLYTEATLYYNRIPHFNQYWSIGNNLYVDTQVFNVDPLGDYLYTMEKFDLDSVGNSFTAASTILDEMKSGSVSLATK